MLEKDQAMLILTHLEFGLLSHEILPDINIHYA